MKLWFSICIKNYREINIDMNVGYVHVVYLHIFPSSFYSQGLGSAMGIPGFHILVSK